MPTDRIDLAALESAINGLPGRWFRSCWRIMKPAWCSRSEAAAIVHAAGGFLHVDAIQAVGRIAVDTGVLDADLLTLSAHKIGGIKGTGALIRRNDDVHFADPLIRGGGQERGMRAGTENVAGIAAFGAAAAAAQEQFRGRSRADAGVARIGAGSRPWEITPHTVIFGEAAERLPNTTLFAVQGLKAETAVSPSISKELRCPPGRRARPARSSRPMSLRPWAFLLRSCAGQSASAWAGAPPKPTSNGSSTLGESL